jgi:beta-D-xylosidase 4
VKSCVELVCVRARVLCMCTLILYYYQLGRVKTIMIRALLVAAVVAVVQQYAAANFCDCHKDCTGADLVWACGTEERDVWANPCFAEQYASLPFCDQSLSIDDRVADLLSRVPIEEKLGSAGTSTPLSNYATELPSVGVRYSQWWSEALHGVAQSPGVKFDRITPYATSFPQIVSTSHSFNRSLFASIGAAIATEVRAFSNVGNAGLTYWTPNLNIFRDPRWGRGQETPGEGTVVDVITRRLINHF